MNFSLQTILVFSFAMFMFLFFASCTKEEKISSIDPVNWEKRSIELSPSDSLDEGTSYLSIYSQIYNFNEHRSQNLTVTVSIRNTNRADSIFINRAEYFNTAGDLIRTYFNYPIFIAPMETVEIIIDQADRSGGSGANFLFDWTIKKGKYEPLFEAVMISTTSSQGISFVTEGRRIN